MPSNSFKEDISPSLDRAPEYLCGLVHDHNAWGKKDGALWYAVPQPSRQWKGSGYMGMKEAWQHWHNWPYAVYRGGVWLSDFCCCIWRIEVTEIPWGCPWLSVLAVTTNAYELCLGKAVLLSDWTLVCQRVDPSCAQNGLMQPKWERFHHLSLLGLWHEAWSIIRSTTVMDIWTGVSESAIGSHSLLDPTTVHVPPTRYLVGENTFCYYKHCGAMEQAA